MSSAHPALYTCFGHIAGRAHFVPEGWEDLDRGICPCGEVVVWNDPNWVPDRSMRVLVLTLNEAQVLREHQPDDSVGDEIRRQFDLQDEIQSHEPAAQDTEADIV